MSEPPILEVFDISKNYDDVHALREVSLSVGRGEVRALLGKNGAGKSTLIKILSGATVPDKGQIFVEGKQVHIGSPAEAFAVGIATVYQEMSLVPGLTVADNILLGRWPVGGRSALSIINNRELIRRAGEALELMGTRLDLN